MKIVMVDMNFCWPPDGGAPVDTHFIAEKMSQEHDVVLCIPRIWFSIMMREIWPLNRTKFFLRGKITNLKHSYRIEYIDAYLVGFSMTKFVSSVKDFVQKQKPDRLFVMDAWYFKPFIVNALKEFKPFTRLYAHEMMCIKGNGLFFRHGKVCDIDFLDSKNYLTCLKCSAGFYMKYPSPRWLVEYILSGAFLKRYSSICREAFANSSRIIVGNRYIEKRLRPYTDSNIEPVYHPVESQLLQGKTNLSGSGKLKFLITGRIEMHQKGIHVALEAFDRLFTMRDDFELIVTDRSIQRAYVKNVDWLSHEEVGKLYDSADVLIVPSIWPDPFPIVSLEAMGMGLPVIASRIGGLPEQIIDGYNGYLFEPSNIKDLMDQMQKVLNDPGSITQMSIHATEMARQRYNVNAVFDKFYRPLIEN